MHQRLDFVFGSGVVCRMKKEDEMVSVGISRCEQDGARIIQDTHNDVQ